MRKGDINVSKEHATILYDQGQYFLSDLGSVNSTFLKVEKMVLREGAVFKIGKDNLFVVHLVMTPNFPESFHTYENEVADPYRCYVDGELMWKEYKKCNAQQYRYFTQNKDKSSNTIHSEIWAQDDPEFYFNKIELRNLNDEDGIITITEEDIRK